MNSFLHAHGRVGVGALALMLWLSVNVAQAKLQAKPGADPETEAEVAAYNDALDGPNDGESIEDWQNRFKTAHDTLFPENPLPLSDTPGGIYTPGTGSDGESGEDCHSSGRKKIDLCDSTLEDWLLPGRGQASGGPISPSLSCELVSRALSNAAARDDVETALENIVFNAVLANVPPAMIKYLARGSVSGLTCTNAGSSFTATVSVNRIVPLGTITVDASASYHPETSQSCVDIKTVNVGGLAALWPHLADNPFPGFYCMKEPLPPFGTETF